MGKNIAMEAIRYIILCFLLFCYSCNNGVSKDDIKEIEKPYIVTDSIKKNQDSVVVEKPLDTVVIVKEETKPEPVLEQPIIVVKEPEPIIEPPKRKTLEEIYLSQVGVREKTGKNDGPEVEMYLKSVGLGKGYAWCAAFTHWCLTEAGYDAKKMTAWSPSAYNKNNIVSSKGTIYKEPKPGDVFVLYYSNLKRIGHTGFFHRKQNDNIYETVEGNTNQAGSREGDGVYRKFRSFKATHAITRWTE